MPDDPKLTFTNELEIKIEGAKVMSSANRLLGACWVECSMNLPTAFHLMFTDNYQELLKEDQFQFILGARIEVSAVVDGQGGDIPLVTGEITGIETDYDGGTTSTVIRGLDHSFKMMRRRRTKDHQDRTASTIIRELAAEDGVTVGEIEESTTRYKHITQANISDWQFATELAARSGMFVDFDNWGMLRFRKLPTAKAPENLEFPELPTILKVGGNVQLCRAGVTAADQSAAVTVRGWHAEQNDLLTSTKEAVEYHGRKIPASPALAIKGGATRPYVETSTPYGDQTEVAAAAESLAGDLSSVFAEIEVLANGNPGLMPGETAQLVGAGESFDGLYTITTARHEFGAGGKYKTWVTVTGRQVRNAYGLAAGAAGSAPRIPGVVNAIVTDINDPDKKGRVMVQFPWLDDDYQSRWARTLQFGGKGGGGVINPVAGDEVLVAFDRGDVNYPYVLGGLYGHKLNEPSPHDVKELVTDGHLNRMSLVARAGHRLELLDAVGMRGVRLRSGNEQLAVFLDQTKTEIKISSDGKVTIKGGADVSVTGDASVSVTSKASISLKAPKVSIEGDVSITGAVNTTGTVSMTGAVNITGLINQQGPSANFKNASFTVISTGPNVILPPPV